MPYIAFETAPLAPDVRDRLIQRLSEVSAEVLGIPAEYFFVSVRELPEDNIAIAGKNVRQMKAELVARRADTGSIALG